MCFLAALFRIGSQKLYAISEKTFVTNKEVSQKRYLLAVSKASFSALVCPMAIGNKSSGSQICPVLSNLFSRYSRAYSGAQTVSKKSANCLAKVVFPVLSGPKIANFTIVVCCCLKFSSILNKPL